MNEVAANGKLLDSTSLTGYVKLKLHPATLTTLGGFFGLTKGFCSADGLITKCSQCHEQRVTNEGSPVEEACFFLACLLAGSICTGASTVIASTNMVRRTDTRISGE